MKAMFAYRSLHTKGEDPPGRSRASPTGCTSGLWGRSAGTRVAPRHRRCPIGRRASIVRCPHRRQLSGWPRRRNHCRPPAVPGAPGDPNPLQPCRGSGCRGEERPWPGAGVIAEMTHAAISDSSSSCKSSWLLIISRVQIIQNPVELKQGWREPATSWFDPSKDGPNLGLMHIRTESAQFWGPRSCGPQS